MSPREPNDEFPDELDDWQPEDFEGFSVEPNDGFSVEPRDNDTTYDQYIFETDPDPEPLKKSSANCEKRDRKESAAETLPVSIAADLLTKYEISRDAWDGIRAAAAIRHYDKDPDGALQILRKVYRAEGDPAVRAAVYTVAAACLLDKKDGAKALKLVNRLLQRDPNSAHARRVLARIHSKYGNPESAKAEWDAAERTDRLRSKETS